MNFKIFVFFKFSKIQCHIVKVYVEIIFFCVARFSDFAQPYMAAFHHYSGSGVMYLSQLSVSLTEEVLLSYFSHN